MEPQFLNDMMILLQTETLTSAARQEHVTMDCVMQRRIFQPLQLQPALPVSDTLQN